MIDLTKSKDAARVLRNAFKPGANPKATRILYHVGDYFDRIGTSDIGKVAYELHEKGLAHLVQRRVSKEPRRYEYFAVVK